MKREANGRASRAGTGEVMKGVALAQPHRRGLPEAARADQRAESVAGRLFLAGRLDAVECEAAERLRQVRASFMTELARPVRMGDFLEGVPSGVVGQGCPGHARSAAGQMVPEKISSEDAAHQPDRLAPREAPEERRERVLAQWAAAEKALWAGVDHQRGAFSLTLAVAANERELSRGPSFEAELAWLKLGLVALGRHWRLFEPERPVRGFCGERPSWGHEGREIDVIYRDRA